MAKEAGLLRAHMCVNVYTLKFMLIELFIMHIELYTKIVHFIVWTSEKIF